MPSTGARRSSLPREATGIVIGAGRDAAAQPAAGLPPIALAPFRGLGPAELGGKGDGLARLAAAGAPTLPFFVVTTAAFARVRPRLESLYAVVERHLRAGDAAGAEAAWRTAADEFALDAAATHGALLAETFRATFDGAAEVAVRSSSVAEDGAALSYAGQFTTRLKVREEALAAAVAECWLSSCAPGAIAYQIANRQAGLRPMAVVVQKMARSARSGVLLTTAHAAYPDTALVIAAYGYCDGVVQGVSDTDSYWVDTRRLRIDPQVAVKEQYVGEGEGGALVPRPLPEAARAAAVLDRPTLLGLVAVARRLAGAEGRRLEIEWTIDARGALYLLQARPITADVEVEGFGIVLDDSNINESFSGPTSRLTFSFAQAIYEDVFREMVMQLSGPGAPRRRSLMAAKRLLSSVGGHVYYNMAAWYALLACLPFRRFTTRAWEAGVGADEQAEVDAAPAGGLRAGLVAALRLAGAVLRRGRRARAAQDLLDRRIAAAAAIDWAALSLHEALDEIEALRAGMQGAWATNMANDLLAALWFKLLQQAVARAGGDPVRDAPALLRAPAGAPPLASLRPSLALARLGDRVAADPSLGGLLRAEGPEAAWRRIAADPSLAPLAAAIRAYCRDYGMRGPFDLKLEVDQPAQRPEGVLALVALRLAAADGPPAPRADGTAAGEADFPAAWRPLLRWLGRRAMAALADREEFRLLRSRIFAVARSCFLRIGDGLREEGVIDAGADIFRLSLEEVQGIVLGSYPVSDARASVAAERAAAGARDGTALPGTIRTARPVLAAAAALARTAGGEAGRQAVHRGIGSSPGRVTAEAVVLLAPDGAPPTARRVVVSRATDPGWVHLLSQAAALVSERGNLLSHSAIVGRELGIPTVVGVKDATRHLASGAMLTVDGRLGTVSVEAPVPAAEAAPR